MAKKKRYKKRKPHNRNKWKFQTKEKKQKLLLAAGAALLCLFLLHSCFGTVDISKLDYPEYIRQDFISKDGHSRTGRELSRVRDIVIHYVGNPGSTAGANRDYFNSSQSNVSSHFVVGLKGEVIQCLPLNEQSSASNQRNKDTISIEVCHPDSTGKFNDKTYRALVGLTAWLCGEFHLDQKNVIRHHDITGKNCPKYYVENPEAWEDFKKDVKREL